MQIIRNNIGRIVIIATLLTVAGGYGYYYAREWVAKWAFGHQTYFAADELILIAVPQTDLSSRNTYLVEEGEFEWQGQMVDVLHREVRLDTLYIYGFRDVAETELKQEAAWIYRNSNQPDKTPDNPTKRVKWFSPFTLPPSVNPLTTVWCIVQELRPFFSCIVGQLPHPLLEVHAPPPNS